MDAMMRVMLAQAAGGGGGGGCGVVLATPYDDNFDCGSAIDTAGTRFSGANAWTHWNHDVSVTESQSGGQELMLVSSNGGLWAPKGSYQSLPAGSGDWTFETDCGLPTWGTASAVGLVLLETATGKHFCPDFTDDGGGPYVAVSGPATLGQYGGVVAGSMTGKLEVARISGNLRVRYDIGSGWVTLVASMAQTTPFTTAPDKVGVFHAPRRDAGSDQSYHNYFYRTA